MLTASALREGVPQPRKCTVLREVRIYRRVFKWRCCLPVQADNRADVVGAEAVEPATADQSQSQAIECYPVWNPDLHSEEPFGDGSEKWTYTPNLDSTLLGSENMMVDIFQHQAQVYGDGAIQLA
eukprot:SAG11_NODE_1436_length_4909_cov_3.825780_7_plen_125_part_00